MNIGYCFNMVSQAWQGTKKATSTEWSNMMNGSGGALMTGAINAASKAAGNLIGGGLNSTAGDIFNTAGSLISNIPGPIGTFGSAAANVIGGLANRTFGSKFNTENQQAIEANINALNSFTTSATNYDDLAANWSNAIRAKTFSNDYLGSDGWLSNKVKNQANEYREQQAWGQDFVNRSLATNLSKVQNQTMNGLLANSFRDGGYLGMSFDQAREAYNNSAIGQLTNQIAQERAARDVAYSVGGSYGGGTTGGGGASGGFYYNEPSQYKLEKDTLWVPIERDFNSAFAEARKKGQSTFNFNGKTYNTEMGNNPKNNAAGASRRELVGLFPLESTKRVKVKEHKYGGPLGGYGAEFTNGLVTIDEGGSHEENPLGGVPMGVGPDGIPNTVQEGEAKFGNYIFSNDINIDKKDAKAIGLKGGKQTYAKAAKRLSKESEERPNDTISKDTHKDFMNFLTASQEAKKERQAGYSNGVRTFDKGGYTPLGSLATNNAITALAPTIDPASVAAVGFNMGNKYTNLKSSVGTTTTTNSDTPILPTQSRYAGAMLTGVQALTDAVGWTNKADYTAPNTLIAAARNRRTPVISFTPVTQKMGPMFVDTRTQANAINSAAGANNRALRNSGLNKGQLAGALIASGYNQTNALGKALMDAQMQQYALDEKRLTFNRATDQYNSEGARAVASANASNRMTTDSAYMNSLYQALAMMEAERNAVDTAKSTNLNAFATNLQNIGTENFRFNAANTNPAYYYGYGQDGTMSYNGNNKSKKKKDSKG